MATYYNLNELGEPEPATLLTWRTDPTGSQDWRLAKTVIGEVTVSTLFMGIDANPNRYAGRPILWETMVFGGPLDGEQFRYETRQQAHAGHEVMCAKVRAASRE